MNRHSNFGYSTILLSFVIVCILTFTALTLLTANSDYKLSKKVADQNTAFYEAQEQAYDELSQVDRILLKCYQEAPDEDSYYESVSALLSSQLDGRITFEDGKMHFSFSKSISSQQYLAVSLLLEYPQNEIDTFYEIEKWQSIHMDMPLDEQPLNLIGKTNKKGIYYGCT